MVRIISHQSFFLSLFHHLNRQLEVRYLMESSGFGCVIVMCTNFHYSFELILNDVYTSQQNIPLLFVDIRQHCRLTICIELVELTNSETAAATPQGEGAKSLRSPN